MKIFFIFLIWILQIGQVGSELLTIDLQHFSQATAWPHGINAKCPFLASKQILQSSGFAGLPGVIDGFDWFNESNSIFFVEINLAIA